jgi:hypothetical protein
MLTNQAGLSLSEKELGSSVQSFLFCQIKVNPFVLSLSKDERIYAELNDFYSTYQY